MWQGRGLCKGPAVLPCCWVLPLPPLSPSSTRPAPPAASLVSATVDNAGCDPEDVNCLHATIGGTEDQQPSDAAVQAVAAWDGHVRRRKGEGMGSRVWVPVPVARPFISLPPLLPPPHPRPQPSRCRATARTCRASPPALRMAWQRRCGLAAAWEVGGVARLWRRA